MDYTKLTVKKGLRPIARLLSIERISRKNKLPLISEIGLKVIDPTTPKEILASVAKFLSLGNDASRSKLVLILTPRVSEGKKPKTKPKTKPKMNFIDISNIETGKLTTIMNELEPNATRKYHRRTMVSELKKAINER